MLTIEKVEIQAFSENCYIVYDKSHQALIFDPGNDPSKIKDHIEKLNVTPIAILLTHAHFDHIGAVDEIRSTYEIPVYLSEDEKEWLENPHLNLSAQLAKPIQCQPADYLLSPKEELAIGNFSCTVLSTPGHSPGSLTYVFEKGEFIVSGDALFAGTIGRTDLPNSDTDTLLSSIREVLFKLPPQYQVYPGHGGATQIEREIKNNPFFN